MKKVLAALVALAVLLGAGLGVFFGLLADRGGGEVSGEALAVGLYGQDVSSGSWPCDDMNDILNPPGAGRFPPVAAVIEAEDVGPPIEIPGSGVASLMAARAKGGRPFGDDKQALKDSEEGVLLYIAIVREASQSNPDLVVSEDEARAYLQAHPPGPCEAGGVVAMPGLTEDQLIRGVQISKTTNNFIQDLINTARRSGSEVHLDQTIADLIAQARPTVKITEVAFGPAGELECTEGGVKVACPSDLPTPEATATP